MGKARREEKIKKREVVEQVTKAQGPQKFDWKRYFGLMGRTLPKILLLFAGTLAVQILLTSQKVPFFSSGVGQVLLFAPMYVMTFIWTQQAAKEMRSPPTLKKPDKRL